MCVCVCVCVWIGGWVRGCYTLRQVFKGSFQVASDVLDPEQSKLMANKPF